jgi:transposase
MMVSTRDTSGPALMCALSANSPACGATLGERGYSKDHRPDLMQMIVAVVIDAAGRPICSEMWPGNTADVTVLIPVIDRLHALRHVKSLGTTQSH